MSIVEGKKSVDVGVSLCYCNSDLCNQVIIMAMTVVIMITTKYLILEIMMRDCNSDLCNQVIMMVMVVIIATLCLMIMAVMTVII